MVKSSKTVQGKPFKYEGSLDEGLTIHFKSSSLKISPEIIRVIRHELSVRSPVRMGANRKPLVANSIGETIRENYKASPQIMSYVVPLLVQEGYCTVNDRKPYVLCVTGSSKS